MAQLLHYLIYFYICFSFSYLFYFFSWCERDIVAVVSLKVFHPVTAQAMTIDDIIDKWRMWKFSFMLWIGIQAPLHMSAAVWTNHFEAHFHSSSSLICCQALLRLPSSAPGGVFSTVHIVIRQRADLPDQRRYLYILMNLPFFWVHLNWLECNSFSVRVKPAL